MKKGLLFLTGVVVGLIIGLSVPRGRLPPGEDRVVTVRDTVIHYASAPKMEEERGTRLYRLAAASIRKTEETADLEQNPSDSVRVGNEYGTGPGGKPGRNRDSVQVDLPIISRHYADSTYEAWVSGPIDPRLDSIRVFRQSTVITKKEVRLPKRWHIGLTAGYGYGVGGFGPYLGVGITYSIISF